MKLSTYWVDPILDGVFWVGSPPGSPSVVPMVPSIGLLRFLLWHSSVYNLYSSYYGTPQADLAAICLVHSPATISITTTITTFATTSIIIQDSIVMTVDSSVDMPSVYSPHWPIALSTILEILPTCQRSQFYPTLVVSMLGMPFSFILVCVHCTF